MPNYRTLNVSLYAGPGIGKSATALGLAWRLSMMGLHVEYVPEYPKKLHYLGTLAQASQHEIVEGLIESVDYLQGKVQVIVSDGSARMSLVYAHPSIRDFLRDRVDEATAGWEFYNVLLHRDITGKYQRDGRYQTEEQAIDFHRHRMIPFVRDEVANVHEVHLAETNEWLDNLAQDVATRARELQVEVAA